MNGWASCSIPKVRSSNADQSATNPPFIKHKAAAQQQSVANPATDKMRGQDTITCKNTLGSTLTQPRSSAVYWWVKPSRLLAADRKNQSSEQPAPPYTANPQHLRGAHTCLPTLCMCVRPPSEFPVPFVHSPQLRQLRYHPATETRQAAPILASPVHSLLRSG